MTFTTNDSEFWYDLHFQLEEEGHQQTAKFNLENESGDEDTIDILTAAMGVFRSMYVHADALINIVESREILKWID